MYSRRRLSSGDANFDDMNSCQALSNCSVDVMSSPRKSLDGDVYDNVLPLMILVSREISRKLPFRSAVSIYLLYMSGSLRAQIV